LPSASEFIQIEFTYVPFYQLKHLLDKDFDFLFSCLEPLLDKYAGHSKLEFVFIDVDIEKNSWDIRFVGVSDDADSILVLYGFTNHPNEFESFDILSSCSKQLDVGVVAKDVLYWDVSFSSFRFFSNLTSPSLHSLLPFPT
jgi:hypothetical protein